MEGVPNPLTNRPAFDAWCGRVGADEVAAYERSVASELLREPPSPEGYARLAVCFETIWSACVHVVSARDAKLSSADDVIVEVVEKMSALEKLLAEPAPDPDDDVYDLGAGTSTPFAQIMSTHDT